MIPLRTLKNGLTTVHSAWSDALYSPSGVYRNVSLLTMFMTTQMLESWYVRMVGTIDDSDLAAMLCHTTDITPISATVSNSGVHLTSLPLFNREGSDCRYTKSIIQNVYAKKWRNEAIKASFPPSERYTTIVRHFTKHDELYLPPNPLEAHALVNALCAAFGVSDSPFMMDFEFTTVHDGSLEHELCTISIVPTGKGQDHKADEVHLPSLPNAVTSAVITPKDLELYLEGMAEKDDTVNVEELSIDDKLNLLIMLNKLIVSVRFPIPYTAYRTCRFERFRGGEKGEKHYENILKSNPFTVQLDAKSGRVIAAVDAPILNRERHSSHLFSEALSAAIDNTPNAINALKNTYCELRILRNPSLDSMCADGDNLPFDAIASVLKRKLRMQKIIAILVTSDFDLKCKTQVVVEATHAVAEAE